MTRTVFALVGWLVIVPRHMMVMMSQIPIGEVTPLVVWFVGLIAARNEDIIRTVSILTGLDLARGLPRDQVVIPL